ncbi:IclR family transcriptional regulator [Ramlibacter rhizophilus]|nr:IclR family transcriptional regulator [Ramlibacter rhizophilus]
MPVADSDDAERTQAGVQSLENGLALVLVLAHHRRPMKLTAVAEQAGVSPGKAHRYLVSFMRAGFVSQDEETGLYGIGPVALEFSLSCLATLEPISLATREAERLCAQTGHTVAVAVWGSFGPTVVRWEQPAHPVMVNVGLGSVFPLYRSATGRVFAAFMPEELVREYAAKAGQEADTEGDEVETIEQVRRRGIARAQGDFMQGMSAFAAPVFDHRGRLVLSVTILGYRGSFDHRWSGPVVAALRESAAGLSKALGYEEAAAPQAPGEAPAPAPVRRGRRRGA